MTAINQYGLVKDTLGAGGFFFFLVFWWGGGGEGGLLPRKLQRIAVGHGVCPGGRDPLEDCTVTESFNKRGIVCFVLFLLTESFRGFILEEKVFAVI